MTTTTPALLRKHRPLRLDQPLEANPPPRATGAPVSAPPIKEGKNPETAQTDIVQKLLHDAARYFGLRS